jgi:osmoprotectant transport system substrate-binding protein
LKRRILALLAITAAGSLLTACGTEPTPVPSTPTAGTTGSTDSATATSGTGSTGNGRKVVVSSKNFTEEFLLGEMYALVLENAGVPVERKLNLGATDIAHAAMVRGGNQNGIDLYPEYTSTGLTVVLKKDPISDPKQVYDEVKKGYKDQFQMTWLDSSPLNDTQAFVTTKENSDKYGLKTLADLCSKAGELRMSVVAEFQDRPDAYPRLKEIYGACDFKELKSMDPSLFYKTLMAGDVEVTQAFSTDGPIAGNGLVLLDDPKNYGLPYNVAPVVRDDVLQMYPQITDTLNKLAPKLTNDVMSGLNWEVDGKQREYADVAREYLQKEGLIK